jgi:hypothetical protein
VIDYIVTLIRQKNIKVLGLLETVGSQGSRIAKLLGDALPGWQVLLSSGQRHSSRHERYLILWDATPGSGILNLQQAPIDNPSTCWLHSTIDDMALSDFFNAVGWNRAEQMECFNTLYRSGYLANMQEVLNNEDTTIKKLSAKRPLPLDIFIPDDSSDEEDDGYEDEGYDSGEEFKTVPGPRLKQTTVLVELPADQAKGTFSYRVNGDEWQNLRTDPDLELNLFDKDKQPTQLGLNPAQLTQLKNILIQTDIVTFPDQESRSPLLLNLLIGTDPGPAAVLTIGLFHAPNPDDNGVLLGNKSIRLKFPGINNLASCNAFLGDNNVLIMGDFNVETPEVAAGLNVVQYDKRDLESEGFGYWPTRSIPLENPFESITGFPVGARALLPNNELTSIKVFRSVISEQAPTNFANAAITYKSQPYDKFFFKADRTQMSATNATVVDLVQIMDASTNGVNGSVYNRTIARQGMKMYKSKLNDLMVYTISENVGGDTWTQNKSQYIPDSVPLGSTVEDRRQQFAYLQAQADYENYRALVDTIQNAENLLSAIKPPTYDVPHSQVVSFFTYESLTHHLPIMVDINVPDPT